MPLQMAKSFPWPVFLDDGCLASFCPNSNTHCIAGSSLILTVPPPCFFLESILLCPFVSQPANHLDDPGQGFLSLSASNSPINDSRLFPGHPPAWLVAVRSCNAVVDFSEPNGILIPHLFLDGIILNRFVNHFNFIRLYSDLNNFHLSGRAGKVPRPYPPFDLVSLQRCKSQNLRFPCLPSSWCSDSKQHRRLRKRQSMYTDQILRAFPIPGSKRTRGAFQDSG